MTLIQTFCVLFPDINVRVTMLSTIELIVVNLFVHINCKVTLSLKADALPYRTYQEPRSWTSAKHRHPGFTSGGVSTDTLSWAVHISGDSDHYMAMDADGLADLIAADVGLRNDGQVATLRDVYMFVHEFHEPIIKHYWSSMAKDYTLQSSEFEIRPHDNLETRSSTSDAFTTQFSSLHKSFTESQQPDIKDLSEDPNSAKNNKDRTHVLGNPTSLKMSGEEETDHLLKALQASRKGADAGAQGQQFDPDQHLSWSQIVEMVHERLEGHPNVLWYSQQVVRKRTKRQGSMLRFNDPYYHRQWHLVKKIKKLCLLSEECYLINFKVSKKKSFKIVTHIEVVVHTGFTK